MKRLARTGPRPRPGIVHLGPGAFFRAFNAVYTDEAMRRSGGDWGIVAVSLKSASARDQLAPQGGVYTSVTLTPDGPEPVVIGSITEVRVAPEDPDAVIARMSDPATRIISLTITEKGYGYDPASKGLDPTDPDIAYDLAEPMAPRSAVGFITAALARRRTAQTPPFTVLSCDNLPSNGRVTRTVTLDFARRVAPDLADWIAAHVPFPSTMVDRITPATTDADIAALAEATGYHDAAAVMHERFRQWVIEDDFVQGRPDWDATFVESVEAHELMKLRCLNGTHSTLAYLGYLAGFETVAEATADTDFAALCRALWRDEITPTVPPPEGEDLSAYCDALLARYQDPSIRHRLWQIAMDGSQKLPQRILGTIRDRLVTGHVPDGLCLAVAAWMRYVGGVDEAGQPIDVRDPLADRLRAASDSAADARGKVSNILAIREVFDPELAGDDRFRAAVTGAYDKLVSIGARSAVASYLGSRTWSAP